MCVSKEELEKDCISRGTTIEAEAGIVRDVIKKAIEQVEKAKEGKI